MKKRKSKPVYFPCWLKHEATHVVRVSPRSTYAFERREVTIKGHRTFDQAYRAAQMMGLRGTLSLFQY
jgi:hypothetical protein